MSAVRQRSEGTLQSGNSRLNGADLRMVAALVISSGAHVILALLMGAASQAESSALNVAFASLQVRVLPTEAVAAEHSDATGNVGTELNVPPTLAAGAAETAEVPDAANLGAAEDTVPLQATAVASALPRAVFTAGDPPTLAQPDIPVFSQEELDVQPVPVDPVIPVYPSEPAITSPGGLIKLQLVIDEDGRVTSVDVMESALPMAFAASATRAFEKVRFRPGLLNGLPVRCRVTTSIQYAPTTLAQIPVPRPDTNAGLHE